MSFRCDKNANSDADDGSGGRSPALYRVLADVGTAGEGGGRAVAVYGRVHADHAAGALSCAQLDRV